MELIEHRAGILIFRAKGEQAVDAFKNESGGHRFQRPSPTDKRGRIHSSTITVAVMPELTDVDVQLNERDLIVNAVRGSGAGGQHRNTTNTCVQITHVPSGLQVRCETERSQFQNKNTALTLLRLRLWTLQKERAQQDHANNRKGQVGSGQRGDKRRTIRVQDGSVTDHITGKSWTWRDYEKGNW